jgi:hypothetical protein
VTENTEYIQGDELLARVLTGDERESTVANELLKEIGRGYPVRRLSTLLQSDNEQAIEDGVWIASELGAGAGPILSDLLPLYEYPNKRIKYYAVELALTAATDQDGEVVGSAISRIADNEPPVRKMAFRLMARANRSVLVAGALFVKDAELADLLDWALEVEGESRDDVEIASRLRESGELRRLFAVIAAARIYRRNPHYLQLAASLGESNAQSLAASELAWLSKLEEQALRRRERAERGSDR